MTVITGRRRIGKTRLILESLVGVPHLYFFVSRQDERLLCQQFTEQIKKVLGVPIYGSAPTFRELFKLLMELAQQRHFTLVIDEFQEFTRVNPSVYSDIQNYWDQYKETAKINLILSGSVQSLMIRIFDNYQEPLFGRATGKLYLRPLSVATLRSVIAQEAPGYSNVDLLTLYAITGGIPYYLETLVDEGNLTRTAMLDQVVDWQQIFIQEGEFLLLQEFGKEHTTYFSVLSLIASGKTTRGKIESVLQKPIGGYLSRLQNDYKVIKRLRPMFSKEGTSNVTYYIDDNFLRFWFRFIHQNNAAVESRNTAFIRDKVERDFNTFLGFTLEKYIRQQLAETMQYSHIGNYWKRGNKNEIDVIAYNELTQKAIIGEVKLNADQISLDKLRVKAQDIIKHLGGYDIEYRGFSLADV